MISIEVQTIPYGLIYKTTSIIVVERPSVLEVSMRLITQYSMILPYRVRYYSPPSYPYNGLVIESLRISPQFKNFY